MNVFSRRPTAFISYRRADTSGHVGRLHDRLIAKWGKEQIYLDIDNIRPGDDFLKAINHTLTNCDIVLLIIGPKWLDAIDSAGNRRLEQIGDPHRLEIECALALDKIIIPILVNQAILPSSERLPPSIKDIVVKNAFEISDNRFDFDVAKLIKSIEFWVIDLRAKSKDGSRRWRFEQDGRGRGPAGMRSFNEQENYNAGINGSPRNDKTPARRWLDWESFSRRFVPSQRWKKVFTRHAKPIFLLVALLAAQTVFGAMLGGLVGVMFVVLSSSKNAIEVLLVAVIAGGLLGFLLALPDRQEKNR